MRFKCSNLPLWNPLKASDSSSNLGEAVSVCACVRICVQAMCLVPSHKGCFPNCATLNFNARRVCSAWGRWGRQTNCCLDTGITSTRTLNNVTTYGPSFLPFSIVVPITTIIAELRENAEQETQAVRHPITLSEPNLRQNKREHFDKLGGVQNLFHPVACNDNRSNDGVICHYCTHRKLTPAKPPAVLYGECQSLSVHSLGFLDLQLCLMLQMIPI